MTYFASLKTISRELKKFGQNHCRKLYGGKATHLAFLDSEGFEIPNAFVITTKVFDEAMDFILTNASDATQPQRLLLSEAFPPELETLLRAQYENFADFPLAIRSSSSDEDSAHHSFAGLQHSILNIESFSAFYAALRMVWRSFYAHERLLYPAQAAPDSSVPSIAVIVQKYIPASASGVIFTKSPINSRPNCMLINAHLGLGLAVVGGENVDSLSLDRDQLSRDPLFISDYQKIKAPALTIPQIEEICRLSLQIEKLSACAQDIEFSFFDGKLHILQTRPIVSAPRGEHLQRDLFSNVNVGEALCGVASPMTWSVGMNFARLGFETAFHTLGLEVPEDYQMVTTFHGRIYLHVSQFLSILSQIPLISQERLARSAGIPNISNFDFEYERLSSKKIFRSLPKALLHLISTQYKVFLKSKSWGEDFVRERDEYLAISLSELNQNELIAAQEKLEDIFNRCGQIMLMASTNFLLSYYLISMLIHQFHPQETQSLETDLFSGLLNVQSAAPGLALLDMARGLKSLPELKQRFLEADFLSDTKPFLSSLKSLPEAATFLKSFDHFLEQYGLRTAQEAELATPRWKENPQFLLQIIQAHLLHESEMKASDYIQKDAAKYRENMTQSTMSGLKKGRGKLFNLALKWAQKNSRLREEWRAYVVDSLGLYRFFLLECANRLIAQKKAKTPEDVFYLSLSEIKAWLRDENSLENSLSKIAFRRARHLAFTSITRMPDTFVLHPHAKNKEEARAGELALKGIPASPGTLTAKARVVHRLSEGPSVLKHGEVLVAQSTDVGWTPLFLLASALLTERGGPLSHSCVVAREYGLPAIVAIPHLLEKVRTGDTLHICAQTGIVNIIERA